jgi:chromosome segregation ATPase
MFQLEIQREMHRLREELLKSRRAEAQREREMAFLQTQLIDAVERIAAYDLKVKSLEDAKKQLDELQAALSAAAASSAIAANSIKAFQSWKPKIGK